MKIFWMIVLILQVLFWLFVFSSVRIGIHYRRKSHDDRIGLDVRALYGLVHLRFEIPIIKLKALSAKAEVKMEAEAGSSGPPLAEKRQTITPNTLMRWHHIARKTLREVHGLIDWLKQTLRWIQCERIFWQSKIGTGDAAETGILTGLIWGVKSTFLGSILRYVSLNTLPIVNVIPLYNQRYLSSEFECILRIRVGHAMLAGIRLLPRIWKAKGGEGKWQSILFRA